LNWERLSKFITDLLSLVNSWHSITGHSSDQTGALGEDISPYVILCRDYERWKSAIQSANAQQQTNRIFNAVVQHSLLEPRDPLGETGAPLCLQVGVENNRDGEEDASSTRAFASSILRENASITGIVKDADVVNGALEPVARGVSLAIAGISGTGRRRSRGNVLSHIERARDIQAS